MAFATFFFPAGANSATSAPVVATSAPTPMPVTNRSRPNAVVLVARADDGTALGCGALRPLEDGAAELKRMYVVPAARGRGVGRAVLAALEEAARDQGWTTLRLETGPRQPEAAALYSRAGYRPIGPFGAYGGAADAGDSLFFERILDLA